MAYWQYDIADELLVPFSLLQRNRGRHLNSGLPHELIERSCIHFDNQTKQLDYVYCLVWNHVIA